MGWLARWWHHDVIDAGKGPLLLALAAFVVTFVVTRTITRMIRDGRGPFHDVSTGGVHMHHSTPGVILLVVGGFTATGASGTVWQYIAAAAVGVGASLVLDEFAMIFRLQDVYWTQEGQLSVNIATLTAACVGFAVAGMSPFEVHGLDDQTTRTRTLITALLVINQVFAVITALKGKYATALLGIFFSPLAWVGTVRLARPRSPWARHFYGPLKSARARARDHAVDARWGPVRRRWDDFIGGTPTAPPA
ncbi:MAG: hypothetical protein QM658_10845 [Gordonia sp. (in: high G+C Gram-positive bacteria)]